MCFLSLRFSWLSMGSDLAALISAGCGIKSIAQGRQVTRLLLETLSACCQGTIFSLVNVARLPKGAIQHLYLSEKILKW